MTSAQKSHWEHVYATKTAERVSWFQEHARASLDLIQKTGLPLDGRIIDVGGGASTLVDDLLDHGYTDISVLDIAEHALAAARERLGKRSSGVRWLEGDITKIDLPESSYDLWHDRAVFHFLTDPTHRELYLQNVLHSVKKGGHIIVATFSLDGPKRCSGLEVMQYDPQSLHATFGDHFRLVDSRSEDHITPTGSLQNFIYCYCRME